MGTGTGCRNRILLTTSSAPPPQVGAAALRARWPVCPPAMLPLRGLRLPGTGGPQPGFCCRSWGCRQPACSPSSPRNSQPRCRRANPRRASWRRPPLPAVEGGFKRLQNAQWCAQPSAIIICTTSCFLPRAAFISHCFPFQVGPRAPRCSASGAASSAGLPATPPAAACWRRGHLCLPACPPSSSCQSYFGKQQLSWRIVNCSSNPFQPG